VTGENHVPVRGATIATTYERTEVKVHTKVAEDTIFSPQCVIAVRLSSARVVYREAAVELVSHLLEELKEPFFDDLLVSRV
jgi:hypothetical protein